MGCESIFDCSGEKGFCCGYGGNTYCCSFDEVQSENTRWFVTWALVMFGGFVLVVACCCCYARRRQQGFIFRQQGPTAVQPPMAAAAPYSALPSQPPPGFVPVAQPTVAYHPQTGQPLPSYVNNQPQPAFQPQPQPAFQPQPQPQPQPAFQPQPYPSAPPTPGFPGENPPPYTTNPDAYNPAFGKQ